MNIMNISVNVGSCTFISIKAYLSYTVHNLTAIIVPINFIITSIFMLETPYFFPIKDRDYDSITILVKLRDVKNSKLIELELESIKSYIISCRREKINKRKLNIEP